MKHSTTDSSMIPGNICLTQRMAIAGGTMKVSLRGIKRRPISNLKTWLINNAIVPSLNTAVSMIAGKSRAIAMILIGKDLAMYSCFLLPLIRRLSDKSLPSMSREERIP